MGVGRRWCEVTAGQPPAVAAVPRALAAGLARPPGITRRRPAASSSPGTL